MRSMLAAAAVACGLGTTAYGQWLTNGSNIYYMAGNVGAGISTPAYRVHAVTNLSGNGSRAIFGNATAGTGVTYGLYGLSASTTGRGVFGWATAPTGGTFGVMGQVASNSGRGVLGLATATSGVTYGVFGESRSTTAVLAASPTNTPAGIIGRATAITGRAAGLLGHAVSPRGAGVAGFETATTGESAGVYGEAHSPSGTGVAGYALATSGSATGVYGTTNSTSQGWAMFAEGDTGASGSKLFHIDHPLDPENKYLNHFCAEGPEPLLIYRGNATLDELGNAWVQLPEYFEAMSTDWHYQLTAVGAPALLYVAREIQGNRFHVAGGQPGMRVSWTVTGRRNDVYMRAYGKPVEQVKTAAERGTYLHPELYGQPAERALRPRIQAGP